MTSIADVRISAGDVTWGIFPWRLVLHEQNGWDAGGGWVHPKGENGVAQLWAGHRKPLPGAGWAVSLVLCMNGRRKQPLLCRASISSAHGFVRC